MMQTYKFNGRATRIKVEFWSFKVRPPVWTMELSVRSFAGRESNYLIISLRHVRVSLRARCIRSVLLGRYLQQDRLKSAHMHHYYECFAGSKRRRRARWWWRWSNKHTGPDAACREEVLFSAFLILQKTVLPRSPRISRAKTESAQWAQKVIPTNACFWWSGKHSSI